MAGKIVRVLRNIALIAFAGFIIAAAPDNRQPDGSTEAQREIARSLERIANTLDKAPQPSRETVPCPKGKEDRQSDLCAQWQAADAAKEAASWLPYQFKLGMFEAVGIAASLAFSALAFLYSVRSFNAFRNAERAHFEFENMQGGNIKEDGEEAVIAFEIKNTGRTAGVIIGGYVEPHICEEYPNKWERPSHPRNIARRYIREGEHERYGEHLSISPDDFHSFLRKEKIFFVDMSVIYKDTFGKKHESRVTANLVLNGDKEGRDVFRIINDPEHWKFT